MKIFIRLSIALACLNIIGEVYRSWGDGRNIVWVLDDVLSGLFVIFAALMFTKDTPARRALFASAWGIGLGMIYMSFFASLLNGAEFNSGNLNWKFLLGVKAFIFLGCICAVTAAILLPFTRELGTKENSLNQENKE